MYWHVTYAYKDHQGVQVMSVGMQSCYTEAQARCLFHYVRPASAGWKIISMKPH